MTYTITITADSVQELNKQIGMLASGYKRDEKEEDMENKAIEKSTSKKPKSSSKKVVEKSTSPKHTIEEVRNLAVMISKQPGGKGMIKSLLAEYDTKNISSLDVGRVDDFYKELVNFNEGS